MRKLLILILLKFTFIGCGSGGGGGGGGSASTGIRILHTSMDLSPISVTTSAKVGETISTTKFGQSVGFSELPTGEQTISVQSVDGGTGPFKYSFAVERGERREVLVYGTRELTGVNATLLELKKLEVPSGSAAVRVVNGVTGAASVFGNIGVTELPATVGFGNASRYVFVPAGEQLIKLVRSADTKVLTNQTINLSSGRVYTFVAGGEVDYLVVGSLLEG